MSYLSLSVVLLLCSPHVPPPSPFPLPPHTHVHMFAHFLSPSQNHNEDGEAVVKEKLAKLSEEMQEQFRKLEE